MREMQAFFYLFFTILHSAHVRDNHEIEQLHSWDIFKGNESLIHSKLPV